MYQKQVIVVLIALTLSACAGQATEGIGADAEPTPVATHEQEREQSGERLESEVLTGLEYRPEAFFENQLDLYLPASDGQQSFPVVLLLHGGGEDKHNMEALATEMVSQGFAVAAANFRSMGGGEYPGTVEDAFCALAWMVDAAGEYAFNTDRFYAIGFSMGGTLAAMLGVVETPELYLADCPNSLPVDFKLRGVVAFTGIFDYALAADTNQAMQEYVEGYLGVATDESPAVWIEASVINWIDGSEPPFLLLHGEADANISPQQTYLFAARLEEAGVAVETIIVPAVEHFGLIADENALQAMFQFIQP